MKKVSEERMKLRVQYSRETNLIFSDDIASYGDWLETKLALSNSNKSVFVICENDDYGRDLYLGIKDTREEAEEIKGDIRYRTIYEHEIE